MINEKLAKSILEAALLVANRPLTLDHLQGLFGEQEQLSRQSIRALLAKMTEECAERGIELVEVASGYRFQVKANLTPWIKRLTNKSPPRYSRAMLETLVLVAYRQPITRSEIEQIRGVSVSSAIIQNLVDYQWIRILAYRDTPGKPALYGTTRAFLDHFNLKSLDELPKLTELREMQDLPENLFIIEEHAIHQAVDEKKEQEKQNVRLERD
jgi:segregation and condensation protein B